MELQIVTRRMTSAAATGRSVWRISCLLFTLLACNRNPVMLAALRDAAEGDIGADRKVEFHVGLQPGQVLLVEAEQRKVDFCVSLTSPGGQIVATVDSPTGRIGTERLLYASERGGEYTVTLSGRVHPLASGRYRVEFHSVPRNTDSRLVDGYRALSKASQDFASGNAKARMDAAKTYQHTATSFAHAQRPELEAESRYALAGLAYDFLSDWSTAATNAGQAAELFSRRQDERRYADSIALQAAALTERGKAKGRGSDDSSVPDLDRAAALLNQAQKINLAQHDDFALARNYNDLGLNFLYRDRFEAAVASFRQAVDLFRRLNERPSELMSLQDIATVQALRGNYRSAADELERLLGDMDAQADPGSFADVTANSAFALAQIGETAAALRRYARALDIQVAEADLGGQARSRQGIANIYWRLGERERALEMFLATLPLREAANDHRGMVVTLVSIGNLYRESGQPGPAAEFHSRALDYVTQNDMSQTDRMRVQIALAADRNAAGDYDGGLAMATEAGALEVPADHPFQARALLERARAAAGAGKLDAAAIDMKRVISMQAAIGASFEESMARVLLAGILRRQQRRGESLAELDQALEQLEALRIQAAGPELRAAFLAARHDAYGQRVDVLLSDREAPTQAIIMEALLTAERSHARSFVDGLNARHESAARGTAASRERAKLYEQLDGHQLRLQLLVGQGLAPTDGRMIELKSEMNLLRARIDASGVDGPSSRAASFDSGSVRAGVLELQRKLRPGDVILNYLLSSPSSWLWIVTRDQVRVVALADQKIIDAVAARFLVSLSRPPAGSETALLDSSRALASEILWPAKLPPGMDRTIVIPDGSLLHVPFAALPASGDGTDAQRMVDRTELTTAYSLSALQLLEKRRRPPVQSPRLMLVADPVFSIHDARVQSGPGSSAVQSPQAGSDKVLAHLEVPRLPGTGVEVDSIAQLVPKDRVRVARGFDANQRVFDELRNGDYSILHFATHLRVDRDDPGLTSLLLSRLDATGKELRGSVAAYDIVGMRLQPQLVVLSACDSSVGRNFRGEGMLGLGRAFLLAGAQDVIATQWPVADRATSELMQRFYAGMLQQGKSPSAALRAAQMAMKRDQRWQHPYYWAGFVAYGSPGFPVLKQVASSTPDELSK